MNCLCKNPAVRGPLAAQAKTEPFIFLLIDLWMRKRRGLRVSITVLAAIKWMVHVGTGMLASCWIPTLQLFISIFFHLIWCKRTGFITLNFL